MSDDDNPLLISEDLVPSRPHRLAKTALIDLDGLLSPPLELHENLKEGCGGQLWPAGMVLAKYCLRHPEKFHGRTVVELGAGGGIVGLAVARGCPGLKGPLQMTDQSQMLALMQRNTSLNNLQSLVKPSVYPWGQPRPAHIPQHPDIILAADCVYFEPTFPLLLSTLEELMGEQTVCLFCQKKRRKADERFVRMARKAFEVREVEDAIDRERYGREGIFLYEFRRKGGELQRGESGKLV